VRTRNSAGLVCIVLAGAACSSPGASQQESQQVATTRAAQSTPSGGSGPTLDLGATDPTQVVSVSIVFKVTQPQQLEALVQATQDPSSSFYHRFLSVQDFARFYAPSTQDIARVSKYVSSFGIQVGPTLADNLVLKATGTVGAFTQAFTFQMHDFQSGSNHYHRPVSPPNVPSSLGDVMLVVAGFSSQPLFTPKSIQAKAAALMVAPEVVLPKNGTATGVAGSYTVGDFANMYDVNPLYMAGIDGTGSTVGIATMANFLPSDAYTYWSSIGLTVRQDRIRQIHIDEGGDLSAAAGSDETTLDVEQSGGIAPGASIVVYDSPNTDGGFLDLFYGAASDNVVDSLSVSWGGPEVFYYNTLLTGGDFTSEMVAFHQAFLEGAAQGISMFAAAGDSGAYDTVEDGIPGLSGPLAVDVPASDPAITAAGGTTTPVTLNAGPGTPNLVVSQEQVWGWDYLQSYLVAQFGSEYDGALFSTGTGGGVSIFWSVPDYQQGYPGVRRTEPGQVLSLATTTGTQTLLTLPAHFAGRNLPDISADADPESGYLLYFTVDGSGWAGGWGGTSFVAPQMNGVSALVRQRTGGRIGLWNAMLYRFAQEHRRTGGAVVDITAGDNWYYDGIPGYEPGAGLGVIDANAFANAVAGSAGCE
jgi:kumamolisin